MRSAGVLCYMIEPVSGQRVYVLGREQRFHGRAGGGRWSDFGGRHDPERDNGSMVKTALRELAEESIETLTVSEVDAGRAQCVAVRSETSERLVYVLRRPYDPGVPARFAERRELLQTALRQVSRLRKLQLALLNGRLPTPGHPLRYRGQPYILLDIRGVDPRPPAVQVVARRRGTRIKHFTHVLTVEVPSTALALYRQACLVRQRVVTLLHQMSPEVLRRAVARADAWVPYINPECLEKEEMRLWSVKALCDALHCHSSPAPPLRTSFGPVLRAVLVAQTG